jgi:DNA-directed RNA polymerase subunit beta
MDKKSYDLTSAGRYKIDHKFKISERLYGRILAEDIHTKSGSVLFKKGTLIGPDELKAIKAASENNEIDCLFPVSISSNSKVFGKQSMKVECISVYVNNEKQESVVPVIGIVPGSTTSTALVLTDFIAAISYTIGLPAGIGQYDDVEHLANKRLRLIHEQLLNKLNVGMARVEKFVKDKLASITVGRANEEQVKKIEAKATLNTIVNTKAFDMIVKQFFNQHQLTQFVDQQNPLSELTNKRRISAMGEGGISRDDPNLDVRDIHPSYYGRICPIESPEGLNIGLILSLAS